MRQNKDVCSLEGLSGCPLLEAITVTECSLESMDGMEECSRVQRLNLSSNKITRISGLGAMTEVTQIWMNDNRITRLDGLSHLTNLSVRAAGVRGVCTVLALFKCKTRVLWPCLYHRFVCTVFARFALSQLSTLVCIRCSR